MGWFSNMSAGFSNMADALPPRVNLTMKAIVVGSAIAYFVALLGTMTYDLVLPYLPASHDSIDNARRQVELQKLRLERKNLENAEWSQERMARQRAEIDLEAYRSSVGTSTPSMPSTVAPLAALARLVTENLASIVTLMFAAFLLPTFSKTGEPARLVLNISMAVILAGVFALVTGALSQTKAEIKLEVLSVTISSASVAVCLILFGVLLAGFSLYTLRSSQEPKETASSTPNGRSLV